MESCATEPLSVWVQTTLPARHQLNQICCYAVRLRSHLSTARHGMCLSQSPGLGCTEQSHTFTFKWGILKMWLLFWRWMVFSTPIAFLTVSQSDLSLRHVPFQNMPWHLHLHSICTCTLSGEALVLDCCLPHIISFWAQIFFIILGKTGRFSNFSHIHI